jgi:hypothetical protein
MTYCTCGGYEDGETGYLSHDVQCPAVSTTRPMLFGCPVVVADFYERRLDGGPYEWRLSAVPVSDPSETLALIAEHRLNLEARGDGTWAASRQHSGTVLAYGPTIGDAVRACVERILRGTAGGPDSAP